VNEGLLRLYELQKIDTHLAELVSSRGELPYRVAEMRDELAAREADLHDMHARISELEAEERTLTSDTSDFEVKLERYKSQQFDVKTTREYDAISFQIEDASHRIGRNQDTIARMMVELNNVREDAESFGGELEHVRVEFAENEKALNELLTETADDEKRLTAEREKVVVQVPSNYLSMYDRIRPAKEGIAVVSLRNGACGGCYHVIPRQLVLELKKSEKHTVCESCGRIVVSEGIAIAIDGEPAPIVYETAEEAAD
jgi:predicted  nucleic acid-binding Zn-ribbon protein